MWRIVPGVVYHWNSISLLERDHSLILLQVLCVPVSKNAIRSSVLCLFRRMLFALVEKVAIYGHDPDPNPQMMTNGWLHVEPVMPIWIPHLLQENRLERLQIKHSSLAQFLKDIVPTERSRSRRFRSFQQSCRNSLIHSKDFFTRWPKDRYLLLTPSKDRVLFSLHLMSLFICFYTID